MGLNINHSAVAVEGNGGQSVCATPVPKSDTPMTPPIRQTKQAIWARSTRRASSWRPTITMNMLHKLWKVFSPRKRCSTLKSLSVKIVLTDGTRGIIRKFHEQNPGRVRLFLSHRNLNDNSVMTRAWQCARGRYIAILDGDDYWTEPHKLQRQVDFLEQHPETFLCGHAVNVIDETGRSSTTANLRFIRAAI